MIAIEAVKAAII